MANDPARGGLRLPTDAGGGKASLSELAYQDLRWQILSGDLAAGILLTEPEICERTGHGKAAARSALAALQHDQLIDIVPRRGFFVRPWSRAEANALMAARQIIEPGIAAMAALARSDADLRALDEIMADWTAAAGTGDPRGLILLDLEFHVGVARASGNSVLAEMVAALKLRSHHQFRMSQGAGFIADVAREHAAIIAAIAARDAAAAERLMRAHVGTVAGRGSKNAEA